MRLLLSGLVVGLVAPGGAAADTFPFAAGQQEYTVPADVSHVLVGAVGAPGGAGDFGAAAGRGATASGVLTVTPGQVLYVEVGGPGGAAPAARSSPLGGAAGFNGGGIGGGTFGATVDPGGGGGGASDVRSVSATQPGSLASRLIIAGGGGGGAGQTPGGAGGGAGSPGQNGPVTSGGQAGGGGAGTASGGGAAGAAGVNGGQAGCIGLPGVGGCGAGGAPAAGGGGGGGLYGGGGGGSDGNDEGGGGGGGGSSFVTGDATGASIGTDTSGTPSVTITPTPVCANVTATTPVGGGAVGVNLSCSVPPGVNESFAIVSPPAHGTVGAVSGSGSVTYISRSGYSGSDSFIYQATDAAGDSNQATVTISVPQSAPHCADVAVSTPAGGGSVVVSLSCSAPTGATQSYSIVSRPAHGTLAAINQAEGTVSYTPKGGFSGRDRFTYESTDQAGTSNVATATITARSPPPRINSTMTWTFQTRRGYLSVLRLTVYRVPTGARVEVNCRGKGCPPPYIRRPRTKRKGCKRAKCAVPEGNVDLTRPFRGRRLAYGGQFTVRILERGWIGKLYIFKIRSGIEPEITCLGLGSTKPGQGC